MRPRAQAEQRRADTGRVSAGAVLLPLLGALACAPATPVLGTPRGAGVAAALFETRTSGTDLLRVRVLFPADEEGAPTPGPPRPALVYVQGGAVATAAYEWQAEALARAGYVVALPEHPLQLAILDVEAGAAVRELLVSPPAGSLLSGAVDPRRVAVGGHSLGGVVALKLFLGGGFAAALLDAAFADSADAPRLSTAPGPVLFVAAEGDCQAALDDVTESLRKLPSPRVLAVIEGATHFQFTDSDARDAAGDCAPTSPLEVSHARIHHVHRVFLDAALSGAALESSALAAVGGVRVSLE